MDLASSYKDKLTYLRIKELKDVLTHLGLSKQGKKQDLVDRILMIFSDEQVSETLAKKNAVRKEMVMKLIDDTHRKMRSSGTTSDLAMKGQALSDSSSVKLKEPEDSYQMEKIRCPCGSTLQDSVIKCEDLRCNIWQHIGCVIIREKSIEDVAPVPPETFYCELCRLSRADPFWVAIGNPLYPVKLTTKNLPTDGTNPVQSIEKTFQLTRADKDLLGKPEYDVQAWCILLNDKVSFRMQWPQYADLQVNGVPMRVINRPGSQLLGANGRDDGIVITPCTRDGTNKISLTGCDARVFCMGVRIVKRRTVQQILSLIPKESDGERFEVALARVRQCVGGGAATENGDSDSDLEVVADSIPVKLCCPVLDFMAPRWKGKDSEAKALADPISKIISELQSSLIHSDSQGILSGCSVLLGVDTKQTELLNHACFGQPIITADKDKQWFQLSLEEAFYMSYSLNCLKVVGEDNHVKDNNQLWDYMVSLRESFPAFYKAYSHLRMKNWVVRSGSQYGVDFVAYRHHPSLVHSEYAVLVSAEEEEGNASGRLKVWSDIHCTLRLCVVVNKTLLVLHVSINSKLTTSLACLESYVVEERTITRWNPEQGREGQTQLQKYKL